jgi:PAS domain S-box-containing protein
MAEISTHHFAPADDEFLATLYNALPDAIVGVEPGSGRILHWNDKAAVMFGRPAQDVLGKSLDVIYADPATFQSFFANLISEIRKRGSWDTKFHVRGSDGADIDADLTAALGQRRGPNGEYVVLVFHQRSRAEDELQSLNDRLLEIVRERTKLLQLLQEIAVIANEASSINVFSLPGNSSAHRSCLSPYDNRRDV